MKKEKKKNEPKAYPKWTLAIYIALRVILVLSMVFSTILGNYVTAVNALFALLLFMLPTILERRFEIKLPNTLELIIIFFIFASVFLGEGNDFYHQFKYWDSMLHTTSGFLSAAIGISLIDLLNKSDKVAFKMTPVFVAIFAFCFSMTVGVVWEFYEYTVDNLIHIDMQKDTYVTLIGSSILNGGTPFTVESVIVNGEVWPGYLDLGLIDTMEDLLVNAAGALVMSVGGYFYIKGKGRSRGKWVKGFLPTAAHTDTGSGDEDPKTDGD